jgi:hypothetical protein
MRSVAVRKQNEETKTTGVVLGAICLAALLWAFPCAAQSQDTPTPQDNPTDSQPQEPEPFPTHSVTSSLDTGSTIDTDNKIISALHVGHWSILDFDLFYAFDSNYLFQPSSPSVSNAAAARALILYSRQNGDSGIDFQYQPYLLASEEGQQRSVFLDQLLDLHVYHHLNAHWVVNVNELFRYEPDTGSLLDPTIIPNYTTGDIFQTPFFADGQQSIQNDLTASFVDTLTARDTLAFHAEYEYAYVTTAFNVPNPSLGQTFQTQNTIGGGVSWNHSWRSNQQFGINYTYARQILGSPNQEEQYQSILFSYRQKLRPTLILELGIGPSIQVHGNGSGSNETFIGNAALLQSFRRAYLTLSFSRDYGYTGVITDSYHDRYDASYSQSVGRRWILSAGIGYIQQHSLVVPQLNGRDYWGRVDYNITRRWGVFAQLMNSAAAGPQQPYASRNFLTAGLRWSSQREHEYQR